MKLLLHVCCGPDVTVALERQLPVEKLALFFDNPNIHPLEEYARRLDAFRKVAEYFHTEFLVGDYDPGNWLEVVKGHEDDPEKGERCSICLQYRLERAASKARESGYDTVSSVFTTSPHKNSDRINAMGRKIVAEYGLNYLPLNLKKKDGFKRSVELSKKIGIYRQSYCGCIYSVINNI